MKMEIRTSMIRALTLLLIAVCLAVGIPDADAQTYDPDTTVYIDALWFRAHAADCPYLILKEQKQTMTLEEADLTGARIGESGQSGRTDCCFVGYQRKYPQAEIAEDAMGVVQTMNDGDHKYHVHGCHRFTPDQEDQRMTLANARSEQGFYLCEHCLERGPGFAQMSDEEWAKLPSSAPWVPPGGWTPSPFEPDTIPPQEEIDILLSQTLHGGDIAIQERVFINPVATVDNFMIMRFFFPVHRWLELYQAYRCTGDTNVLEQLRGSARHYNTLSKNDLSAAQLKAKDPEGLAYMYTMAASARITLQLARKYPDQVTAGELAEAADFLMTMVSVLQPVCEGNDNLDPQMGIPQPLADDFRTRAFNRALNGIGTIGMATAALQDLQVLNSTTAYQSTIDRYRLIIQEYIKNWKSTGFEETYEGKDYFSYPYSATDSGYMVGEVKLFGADDQGHFTHSMQGCYLLFESVPELGIDDAFMTAIANTIYFNSYTTSGSPQTPSQEAIRPHSRYPYGSARERFYLLEAFKDGVIDGQCSTLSASQTEAVNSDYEHRRATLNAQYLKALRQDRSLIYLGDEAVIPPAAPTGLAATAGDGLVALDWNDNTEGDLVGYSVYRSTTSGSGYALITNGLISSAYEDNAVFSDTTYYYVVTATDISANESALSAEASATPTAVYYSQTVLFGSGSDGLGGFTQSVESTINETWTTETVSVKYRNQDDGTLNSSLLKEITLDRSNGNSYTVEGVVHLTDGYADDNNRVGIYLFGDYTEVLNEYEAGAIGVIFNTDDSSSAGAPGSNADDDISVRVGIDGISLSGEVLRNQAPVSYAQDLFGTEITLTADITFTNVNGTDSIQIEATLTDWTGAQTLIPAITVDAAAYTGNWFGFVTRARARNYPTDPTPTPEERSSPWVMDYRSFSVVDNNTPVVGYVLWASGWGTDIGDSNHDYEPDGIANWLEYALGGDPTADDAADIMPVAGMGSDGEGNWLYYTYNRRADDPDLIYTVWAGTNLLDGLDIEVPVWNVSPETNGIESAVHRMLTDDAPAGFMKLEIELAE